MQIDRSTFGDRQAEMTARWYENVKLQHGDVDAYIANRQKAYLDRWREAGRFIADSARVLDIGGGNLYPTLIDYFKKRGFRYSYMDVDPAAVDGSRHLAEVNGLHGFTFEHGFNDKLAFQDRSFDAVFSSHCIEHSIDLVQTFKEINRVLVEGGNLLMAVPFGWEINPEHPYFLGPDEWISLVEDAGFRVRIAQIGSEYPEFGEDYFVAAQKIAGPSDNFRIPANVYCKSNYNFVDHTDKSVTLVGDFQVSPEIAISSSLDSRLIIASPKEARMVFPILSHHPWSGIIKVTNGLNCRDHDLYSWFSFDMPLLAAVYPEFASETIIDLIGASPTSRWSQFVFKGYLWR